MDFNTTIDLIIKDLSEAREIIDDLKKIPGVPLLQVELAKSKCKSAEEVIALLKNEGHSEVIIIEDSSGKGIEPPAPDKKETAASVISIQQTLDEIVEIIPAIKTAQKVKINQENTESGEKISETSIMADKFSHLSDRFNEQLGSRKSEDEVSDIMRKQPLSSLQDAIGLNDKFLFIREIFGGNSEVYNVAIQRLDSSENLADAKAVIMKYTDETDENMAVNQLLDLLKRKFSSNE